MKTLYAPKTANYPRLATDVHFADYTNRYQYTDMIDRAMKYIEDFQLLDPVHWKRFVTQFQDHTDEDAGWRGEYWGKMMRGACFVYAYTRNPELYAVLKATITDMMACHAEGGRISS